MRPEDMRLWLPNQLARNDRIWSQRRAVAAQVFGQARAAEVEELSIRIVQKTKLSRLNAFEVAMQVETEWPGHLADVLDRADIRWDQTDGKADYLLALLDVIKWIRAQGPDGH